MARPVRWTRALALVHLPSVHHHHQAGNALQSCIAVDIAGPPKADKPLHESRKAAGESGFSGCHVAGRSTPTHGAPAAGGRSASQTNAANRPPRRLSLFPRNFIDTWFAASSQIHGYSRS